MCRYGPNRFPHHRYLPSELPEIAVENEAADLEDKIGKVWFNRIGILALLIGVSYFIKYAFDSGWIGPAGRIAVGLVAGIGLVLWSERFRSKGFTAFSYSLKAVGIGTLYLSLWGAFQLYHLVPSAAAFVAMVAVTASTIVLALTQDAEILAAFALIGGFSTPILLSTGENHEVVLFSYVALLDLAVLAMIKFKPWYRLLIGAFIGTLILYMGWGDSYYTDAQRGLTVFYVVLFAAIFAVSPLLVPLDKSRWRSGFSITFMLLPLANAAALFLALFGMYNNERVTLTWYALALAAIYLALSSLFKRRAGSDPEVVKIINLLHIAIAIAFVTIAIPLKLSAHWITIGWMVESAVLLFIGVRTRTDFLRYFAATTLILGVVRLLFLDNFQVDTLRFQSPLWDLPGGACDSRRHRCVGRAVCQCSGSAVRKTRRRPVQRSCVGRTDTGGFRLLRPPDYGNGIRAARSDFCRCSRSSSRDTSAIRPYGSLMVRA